MVALSLTIVVAALAALGGSDARRVHPGGNTQLCLTQVGSFSAGNATVEIQECDGRIAQNWIVNPFFVTKFRNRGRCLGPSSGESSSFA